MKVTKLPAALRTVTVDKPLTNGELDAINMEVGEIGLLLQDENTSDAAADRALDRLDVFKKYLKRSKKIAAFRARGLRLVG